MDHIGIERRLLALEDEGFLDSESPFTPVIVGVIATLTIVITLVLCTCKDQPKKKEDDVDSSKVATPVPERMQTGVATDSTEVILDIESSSVTRHSANGSVVRENGDANRPKSHDQRALPEIPATSAALQTDEEEETEAEGHYDVISNARNKKSLAIKPVKVVAPLAEDEISPISTHPRTNRPHDYEPVDLDNESLSPYATGQNLMYAGFKEDDSEPESYGTVKNPYAVVEGVGSADYAHIEDRRTRNQNSTLSRGLGLAPQASIETLDEGANNYSSVAAPPVPDKKFDEDPLNTTPPSHRANSPRLPPRNGDGASHDGLELHNGVALVTVDGAAGADMLTMTGTGLLVNGTITGKREPPYSRVTARESLAHLRQREAQEMMAAAPPDTTYESVNYDQIKTPASGASGGPIGDRNSLTSDLYAEIASGENSSRSSVYARVDEVPLTVHAPTPPPVDILKTLSIPPEAEEREIGDPGYSVIRRSTNRPQSAVVSSPPVQHPVYAKVDKNRKYNRASVHVSQNLESQNFGASGASGDDASLKRTDIDPYSKITPKPFDPYSQIGPKLVKNEDQYAEVKPVAGKVRQKETDPYSRVNKLPNGAIVPLEYQGTGARPKVLENGHNGASNGASNGANSMSPEASFPSAPKKRYDPGYTTITSFNGYDVEVVDGADGNEMPSEFDPNYETVAVGSEIGTRQENSLSTSEATHGTDHVANNVGNLPPAARQIHREHIYQEIGDAKKEKERYENEQGAASYNIVHSTPV